MEAAPATDTAETAMDRGSIAVGCSLLNHTRKIHKCRDIQFHNTPPNEMEMGEKEQPQPRASRSACLKLTDLPWSGSSAAASHRLSCLPPPTFTGIHGMHKLVLRYRTSHPGTNSCLAYVIATRLSFARNLGIHF